MAQTTPSDPASTTPILETQQETDVSPQRTLITLLQQALNQAQALQDDKNNVQAKLSDTEQQRDSLQAQLESLQRRFDALQSDYSTAQTEVRELTVSRDTLREEVSDLSQTRDQLTSEIEALTAAQGERETEVRVLQSEAQASQAEITRLEEALQQAQTTAASLRDDNSTVRAERDSLQTVADSFQSAEQALRQRIVTLQQERDRFEARAGELEVQLSQAQQARDDNQATIVSLQADAGKAQALADAEARIATLEDELAQQRQIALGDVETLRAQVLELRDTLESSQAEVARIRAERDNLQQTLDTQANSDYRLARDIALEVQGRIETLQQEINRSGGATAEQVSQLEALREEFRTAQEGIVRATNSKAVHIVKLGESLSQIAENYYDDMSKWQQILEANSYWIASEDDIRPGDVLIIP